MLHGDNVTKWYKNIQSLKNKSITSRKSFLIVFKSNNVEAWSRLHIGWHCASQKPIGSDVELLEFQLFRWWSPPSRSSSTPRRVKRFFRCETKVARHHIETMRNSEFSENQDFGCVVAKGTLKNHRRYMEISCYLRNVCWCAVAAWERVQGSKASVGHAWIGSQEHSIRRSMEQHSAGAATTLVCQVSDSKKRFRWSLEMSTLKNWNLMWVLTLPFSHFSSSLPMVICCEKPLRSRFWCRWDPSDIADIPPGSSSRGIARKSPPAMPCQLKLCCQVGSKKIQDQTWFSTLILFSTLFDCEDEKWYAKNWKMENGDHKRWPSLHHWPRNAMKPRGGEVHLSVTNLMCTYLQIISISIRISWNFVISLLLQRLFRCAKTLLERLWQLWCQLRAIKKFPLIMRPQTTNTREILKNPTEFR